MVKQEQKYFSDVRSRNAVEASVLYDKFPMVNSVPQSLKMPFEQILNKPYLAKVATWSTTDLRNTTIANMKFPYDFLVNEQLKAPFKLAAKYRLKACVFLQTTGTPMHQGLLLAATMPSGCVDSSFSGIRNNFLQAPHIFMSANEATPVCLEVPFYSNTKLQNTNLDEESPTYTDRPSYAELQIIVWNPLLPATSASTSLSVSIHVMFTMADFYIPKNQDTTWVTPSFVAQSTMVSSLLDSAVDYSKKITGDYIDKLRSTVKSFTGLHNPNVPILQERMLATPRNFTNNVDIPTYFEKMDPYADHNRFMVENTFYTDVDEMQVSNIIRKPQFIGYCEVSTASSAGALLWSRPITPYMDPYYNDKLYTGVPLQTFHHLTKFWKGTIKLHIQSVMTNFHNVKLLIARNYSNNANALLKVPDYNDVVALQSTTIEFSGGSQTQTVELEYCSELEQLPNVLDPATNALSHGVYYIYLAQPLVASGNVSGTVAFNIYISAGDDFEFYGYSTNNYIACARSSYPVEFEAQSVMVEPSGQADLQNRKEVDYDPVVKNFRPVLSTREFVRRFAHVGTYDTSTHATRTNEYDTVSIPVSALFKRFSPYVSTASTKAVCFQRFIRQFYLGQTGGFKFKFHVYNAQDATVKYVPPTMSTIPTVTDKIRNVLTLPEPTPGILYTSWIARNMYPFDDTLEGDMYSPPFIETGTWTKPYLAMPDNIGSELMSTSQIQIECVIPNMSPLEFIGDSSWFQDESGRPYPEQSTSDLGSFIVSCMARNSNEDTVPTIKGRVVIYMAYADESRLGFNVCCPVLKLHAQVSGSLVEPIGYENTTTFTGFTDYEPANVNANITAPASYIGQIVR